MGPINKTTATFFLAVWIILLILFICFIVFVVRTSLKYMKSKEDRKNLPYKNRLAKY